MPIEAEIVAEAVERWAGVLTAWLRSRTTSPEDVVQETFCRLACLEQPPERMAAWLFQVALNLCREEMRRTKRRLVREQGRAQKESISSTAHVEVVHREVREAIERLQPELRDLVIARLWGGLTLQESAELLKLSTTTAHRRYQDSISQLRQLLTENEKSDKAS